MQTDSNLSTLQIYTLGDVRVELDAQPVTKLTKPTKALLVYLVLHPARAHKRETLAQLFWLATADEGDDLEEKRAQDSVRKALQILRAALGDDLFLEDKLEHTLRVNPARHVWTDGRAADTAARLFLAAPRGQESPLSYFRGEFMAGYDDLPAPAWIERERARLTDLENQVLIADARAAKQRGEYARALANAERILERDPLNQDAAAEAMWCQWRLNQSRVALDLYENLKRGLKERNEIPLAPLRQLRTKIQSDVERATRRALQLTNLPVRETTFVGRTAELSILRGLLRLRRGITKRLVTLVGPGGSGKTRLARELADSVLKQFRDGVWWIELDALDKEKGSSDSTAQVAQAIATVLGVRHETERPLLDTLVAYLRDKKMLLVLDNCEHVIRGCGGVSAKILANCPRVQMVATSREALRITGEKHVPLATLDTPTTKDAASLKTLAQFDSVRLFLDRARIEQEQFNLTQDNARDIAQLCRRLDGLPLALELAAARLNTRTLREIVDGLDERFALLNRGKRIPARHETLRAVLDWSDDLLDPNERALFAVLGVFAGRFTEEAVEAVREGEMEGVREEAPMRALPNTLESLVDKSLVQLEFEGDGARRYRLLETLRAYVRERLDEDANQADAAYVRMARYYLSFAKTHQQDFIGLEREWDNLSYGLSIMHWQENWQEVLDYGYALTDAAFARGLYTQARTMYRQVMEAAGHLEEQGADIQMRLNYARALIEQGFYPEAREVLEQLLRISEVANDFFGIAGTKTLLGRVAREQSRFAESKIFLASGLDYWEQQGNSEGVAECLMGLAYLEKYARTYESAIKLAGQALNALEHEETSITRIELIRIIADSAYLNGDLVLAEVNCKQALDLCKDETFKYEYLAVMHMIAQIHWKQGHLEAARIEGEAASKGYELNGDRKSHAFVLNFLISVYVDMKDYLLAKSVAAMSEKILNQLGDEWAIIYVWRDKGKIFKAQGKQKLARQIWTNALERIESTFPDHPMKPKILELLT